MFSPIYIFCNNNIYFKKITYGDKNHVVYYKGNISKENCYRYTGQQKAKNVFSSTDNDYQKLGSAFSEKIEAGKLLIPLDGHYYLSKNEYNGQDSIIELDVEVIDGKKAPISKFISQNKIILTTISISTFVVSFYLGKKIEDNIDNKNEED